MKRLLFCLFLMALGRVFAQQPAIQWQKALGGTEFEQARYIQQTSDGGFAVVGHTLSNNGDVSGNHGFFDVWAIKMDKNGSIQWKKALGGGDNDRGNAIQQTIDGGFVLAGFTESNNGDVSGNHGDKDAWIIKLNNAGGIEWQKTMGGSRSEEALSIQQTLDGGYIWAGRASSTDREVTGNHAGSLDFWVVKLNSIGDIEWQKSLGGDDEDSATSIKQTLDGGYIVVGETKSTNGDVVENNGNVDFWVLKLNGMGDIEWQNSLGGSGWDVASDVVETSEGFIVCGYVGSNNTGDVTGHQGLFDYWVVKLNKTGDLLWQRTYGGSAGDWARSIIETNDGMYVITGTTQSSDGDILVNNGIETIWTIKLNGEGDLVWQISLGGTEGEGGNCIKQTSDGGFVIAGYAWSNNGDVTGNHGGGDFWVVKLAPPSTPTTQPTAQTLNLYPNPATNSITIQIPDTESTLHIQITDLLGRELGRQTIPNGGTVDIDSLPNGLYLVSARTESGEVFLGRVCKQE